MTTIKSNLSSFSFIDLDYKVARAERVETEMEIQVDPPPNLLPIEHLLTSAKQGQMKQITREKRKRKE